jgi:hypothetical protein
MSIVVNQQYTWQVNFVYGRKPTTHNKLEGVTSCKYTLGAIFNGLPLETLHI